MAVRLSIDPLPEQRALDTQTSCQSVNSVSEGDKRQARWSENDNPVHELCIEHRVNNRLVREMRGLQGQIRWAQSTTIPYMSEPLETTFSEHFRICRMLVQRNGPEAEAPMRDPLNATSQRTQDHLVRLEETKSQSS